MYTAILICSRLSWKLNQTIPFILSADHRCNNKSGVPHVIFEKWPLLRLNFLWRGLSPARALSTALIKVERKNVPFGQRQCTLGYIAAGHHDRKKIGKALKTKALLKIPGVFTTQFFFKRSLNYHQTNRHCLPRAGRFFAFD